MSALLFAIMPYMKVATATFALCMALFTGNVVCLMQGAYDSVKKRYLSLDKKQRRAILMRNMSLVICILLVWALRKMI